MCLRLLTVRSRTRSELAGHLAKRGYPDDVAQTILDRLATLLSDPAAYRYLPKSVAYLPEPSVMLDQLAAAGFCAVRRDLLSTGISQLVTATREKAEWAGPGH